MRWLRRRTPAETAPLAPPADVRDDLAQARAAREASEQALQEVCERWPEVKEIASSLRAHRKRNNFRAMFERALKGGEV